MLAIQIRRVEKRKEYLVLIISKKYKEGRNTSFSKTKNTRKERRMFYVRYIRVSHCPPKSVIYGSLVHLV